MNDLVYIHREEKSKCLQKLCLAEKFDKAISQI